MDGDPTPLVSAARVAIDASEDRSRLAIRITVDFLLRSVQLLLEFTEGDVLSSLIAMAIAQANVAHLTQGDEEPSYASLAEVPPDEVRRPVSVLAIAQSLGLPYETTRRHVEKLIAAGACRKVKGGVIVPAAALDTEANRQLLVANMANLRRLARTLRAAGIDLG